MKEPELKPIASTPEPKPTEKPETPTTTIATATIPKPNLSAIYTSIDLAPKDWLPSIIARASRRAAKENIWPDTDAMLGAVKTFVGKKP